MTSTAPTRPVTLRAPAKLNLGLRILGERPDGYHNLVTVYQTLALSDRLVLGPRPLASEDRLTVEGPVSVDSGSDNLVLRALERLRRSGWEVPPLHVRLHKRIPTEAGLGGGSSDAAAVLRAVSSRWSRPEDAPELSVLAQKLGADVPFLLRGGTAVGRGIGHELTPLPAQRARVLLAVFPSGMSSRRAFEALGEEHGGKPSRDPAEVLREHRDEHGWSRIDLSNDFAPFLVDAVEGFTAVRAGLSDFTEDVAPTGSGTALYGLFREADRRDRAYRSLRERFPEVRWMRTRFLNAEELSRSSGG